MRNVIICVTLACAGCLSAEETSLLKVDDTVPPCYPQYLAGPDKGTNTCPV